LAIGGAPAPVTAIAATPAASAAIPLQAAAWTSVKVKVASAFGRYGDDPCAQLRAIIPHTAERTTRDGYRGCPFIHVRAEFPDPSHPGRMVARETKQAPRQRRPRPAVALRAAAARGQLPAAHGGGLRDRPGAGHGTGWRRSFRDMGERDAGRGATDGQEAEALPVLADP
jgi:hypothetical protein